MGKMENVNDHNIIGKTSNVIYLVQLTYDKSYDTGGYFETLEEIRKWAEKWKYSFSATTVDTSFDRIEEEFMDSNYLNYYHNGAEVGHFWKINKLECE